jgi:uncharacterized protein (DUF1810 family)
MSPSLVPPDPFDLQRFVRAQDPLYSAVTDELSRGRKQTHWIWFIFPQVDGLGRSVMARRYAIHSRAEAAAYLAHPVLSGRLLECTELVLANAGKSAFEIFGSPDDLKFRSSMTLFDAISKRALFRTALETFFGGAADQATLAFLADGESR